MLMAGLSHRHASMELMATTLTIALSFGISAVGARLMLAGVFSLMMRSGMSQRA